MARILVIDDDDLVRRFIQKALTRAGHEVLPASNGDEGLTLFREGGETGVDLVITDIFMPERDGVEVLIEILKLHAATPILVISGGSPGIPKDFLQVADALGAHATLPKPFTPAELLAAVDRLLSGPPALSPLALG